MNAVCLRVQQRAPEDLGGVYDTNMFLEAICGSTHEIYADLLQCIGVI
jgi:hypothetical protein